MFSQRMCRVRLRGGTDHVKLRSRFGKSPHGETPQNQEYLVDLIGQLGQNGHSYDAVFNTVL